MSEIQIIQKEKIQKEEQKRGRVREGGISPLPEIYRYGISFNCIPLHLRGRLRNILSVKSMGFGGKLTTRIAYHQIDKQTYGARKKMLEFIIKNCGLPGGISNCIPLGEDIHPQIVKLILNPLQDKIKNYILEKPFSEQSLTNGTGSFYLDLPPGKGKTFVAASLIQHFKKKSLYIVPGSQLLKETQLVLKEIFPDLKVAEYSGSYKEDGDIVVMTIDSATGSDEFILNKKKISWDSYFSRFGISILDEVHEYCTKIRSSVFYRCGARIQLGMSGTSKDRLDKMDGLAYYWFGKPFDAMSLLSTDLINQQMEQWKAKLVCIRYNGPIEYTQTILSSKGTTSAPKMITQISKDPYRISTFS